MQPLDQLILQALSGIYSSELSAWDLTKIAEYSPARIAQSVQDTVDVQGLVGVVRDVGAAVTVLLAVILVVVLVKARALNRPKETPVTSLSPEADLAAIPVPDGPLKPQWVRVLAHLDSPREADWKLAVIEADKLAERALSAAGFAGAGLGEKLMNIAPGNLITLDGLWWAHKVRNRLAHEMDYFLRYTEARQAIGYYEQALNELRAI